MRLVQDAPRLVVDLRQLLDLALVGGQQLLLEVVAVQLAGGVALNEGADVVEEGVRRDEAQVAGRRPDGLPHDVEDGLLQVPGAALN